MSIFHCVAHDRDEDSDYVGCVETPRGPVCDDGAPEIDYLPGDMTDAEIQDFNTRWPQGVLDRAAEHERRDKELGR